MHTFIKRIIQIEVAGQTPEELLQEAKKLQAEGTVISDTFLVEDDQGMIVAKEKVVYTTEKTFVFGG